MAASNLVLLCKSSGLCAAACIGKNGSRVCAAHHALHQLLIRHRLDTLHSYKCINCLLLVWWIHWTIGTELIKAILEMENMGETKRS